MGFYAADFGLLISGVAEGGVVSCCVFSSDAADLGVVGDWELVEVGVDFFHCF